MFMQEVIKMLRYNTGTDKKAFVDFKDRFDAVIFNATIVAYSGSAVADLVSVHKHQYIIDPQTHIMQHDIMAIMSKDKKTEQYVIKKSVRKYLENLPEKVLDIIEREKRYLNYQEIDAITGELVECVYSFETEFVNGFVKKKEYDKYLQYAQIGLEPRVVIAPYFMLKKDMSDESKELYMNLNRKCLQEFIAYNNEHKKLAVAAQLVIDKEVLSDVNLLRQIENTYALDGYEYIFLWINDFSSWEVKREEKEAFYNLVCLLNSKGKKPIMAYGGFDSILLCHRQMDARLFGVAQSVGYGEQRAITPVGGGLPVNKYYFGPTHRRIRFDEALYLLMEEEYFSDDKTNREHAEDYYKNICNCPTCREIIQDDIDNFRVYNESTPYLVKGKHGDIKRNRPTTEATLVAAYHFLYRKDIEWNSIEKEELKNLIDELIKNYEMYGTQKEINNIKEWCEIFAK